MKIPQSNSNILKNHPGFHIWIFNHPMFYGIGDQLHFLFKYFQQLGVKITCGRQPSNERCNLVIENFDSVAVQTIKNFCLNQGKSISIVLTEHIDIVAENKLPNCSEMELRPSSIYLHGKPINSNFFYLPSTVLLQRANCLLALSRYTSNYFRLGDLPKMHGFECLVHNRQVDTLWFPRLDPLFTKISEYPKYDFIFCGAETIFRKSIISKLKKLGFSLAPTENGISVKRRHYLYKQAKFCLNIPQDETWQWLSPMRIISALQAGLPTLSIGTNDASAISSCIKQMPIIESEFDANKLRDFLKLHKRESLKALESYDRLVMVNNTLPVSLIRSFNSWVLTDGISF